MRIVSISENKNIEKRIAITLEIAKKYISLGFELSLSENYGEHLGFDDNEYKNLGVKILKDETGKKNIVFSGGLFQNVSLNKALLNIGFENVYFPSAPSDSGLSLGAALYVKNKTRKNKTKKYLK